ncbi:hypothetical protein ACFXJO_21555 [Streptomyces lavendulae]|uniref:hypothetical protein n=1 Tax=Streptomyces lavendulae TaxID=1914 RepID=UPI0036BB163B
MHSIEVVAVVAAGVLAGLCAPRAQYFTWPMYIASSLMIVWARDPEADPARDGADPDRGPVVAVDVVDLGLAADSHDLLPADLGELSWADPVRPAGAVFLTSAGSFTARFKGARVCLDAVSRPDALEKVAFMLAGLRDVRR